MGAIERQPLTLASFEDVYSRLVGSAHPPVAVALARQVRACAQSGRGRSDTAARPSPSASSMPLYTTRTRLSPSRGCGRAHRVSPSAPPKTWMTPSPASMPVVVTMTVLLFAAGGC